MKQKHTEVPKTWVVVTLSLLAILIMAVAMTTNGGDGLLTTIAPGAPKIEEFSYDTSGKVGEPVKFSWKTAGKINNVMLVKLNASEDVDDPKNEVLVKAWGENIDKQDKNAKDRTFPKKALMPDSGKETYVLRVCGTKNCADAKAAGKASQKLVVNTPGGSGGPQQGDPKIEKFSCVPDGKMVGDPVKFDWKVTGQVERLILTRAATPEFNDGDSKITIFDLKGKALQKEDLDVKDKELTNVVMDKFAPYIGNMGHAQLTACKDKECSVKSVAKAYIPGGAADGIPKVEKFTFQKTDVVAGDPVKFSWELSGNVKYIRLIKVKAPLTQVMDYYNSKHEIITEKKVVTEQDIKVHNAIFPSKALFPAGNKEDKYILLIHYKQILNDYDKVTASFSNEVIVSAAR